MVVTIDEVKTHLRIQQDEEDGYISGLMWVRFRDKKWFISTLGEYGFRCDYLGLKASLSEGVSG